jgi:hypothetical protein
MRIQRTSPQSGGRSRRAEKARARNQATPPRHERQDQDPFMEIQAESGRRMRPIVAEHYGETE